MKVAIAYPPLHEELHATLGQNRQFQWFHNPSFIYPMVPAWAATMLRERGHEVLWVDAIAMRWKREEFFSFITKERPSLILFETKTPVVRKHWEIINELKVSVPETNIALCGDHVTALPEESMRMSNVDFVLTGGDYDFLTVNLAEHLEQGTPLEPGVWYRKNGEIKSTGSFTLEHDLDELPLIDRELTRWELYGEHLFKKKPHTYIMSGRDCWWGKCSFCSWTTLYPRFRVRSVEKVLDEIGMLIDRFGVREIFDDTGTFPVGAWLKSFCDGMIERGYSKKVLVSCNARVDSRMREHFDLMGKAGFRVLKFGLESANQKTLDRLCKGTTVSDIIDACALAKRAGLTVHLTTMVGYPWESLEDAKRTLSLARYLFSRGYADMLQATIVIPYPGTPLFEEALAEGWLRTTDWETYDMIEPVLATPIPDDEIKRLTRGLYTSFLSLRFVMRTLLGIRDMDDVRFIWKALKAVGGHFMDFLKPKRK